MDKNIEYLSKFSKLAEAAEYYLEQSFNNIHKCLTSELAGLIFQELMMLVETNDDDDKLINNFQVSDDIIEILTEIPPDVLTEDTHGKIEVAWTTAQKIASITGHNFSKIHSVKSIEILGHLGNFAFFFETLVNRHLLYLVLSKQMDEFTYNNLNRAKILTRLVYVFKEELSKGEVHLNEIAYLYKLRNKTVHFTPDNAISIEAKIDALIRIWKQAQLIIGVFQKKENFKEKSFSDLIEDELKDFYDRWLNQENSKIKEVIEKVRAKVKKKGEV